MTKGCRTLPASVLQREEILEFARDRMAWEVFLTYIETKGVHELDEVFEKAARQCLNISRIFLETMKRDKQRAYEAKEEERARSRSFRTSS